MGDSLFTIYKEAVHCPYKRGYLWIFKVCFFFFFAYCNLIIIPSLFYLTECVCPKKMGFQQLVGNPASFPPNLLFKPLGEFLFWSCLYF